MGAWSIAKLAAVVAVLSCVAAVLSSCGGAEQAGSGGAAGTGGKMAESGAEFAAAPESQGTDGTDVGQDFARKIVKTAELGIRAAEVRETAARAERVAAGFGGSVSSSQTFRGEGSVRAELVLSVPASEFEAALGELRGLGEEVTTDSVSGEDVTEEFVDLRSRERNLIAAEESLLGLYERAEDVEDALSIQRELTDVRGRVEAVQGRIQYLQEITASSSISLSIEPVAPAPTDPPAWDPALVATRAWNASLGVLQGLANAVISVLVFGWWLLPALLAAVWGWRRRVVVRPSADPDA